MFYHRPTTNISQQAAATKPEPPVKFVIRDSDVPHAMIPSAANTDTRNVLAISRSRVGIIGCCCCY